MSIAVHTPRRARGLELPQGWFKLRHHPVQRALWSCKKRYVKVTAGRISGKTTMARRRIVSYLAVKKPWPKPQYFYALPTYGWAKKVAWDQVCSLVPKHWLEKAPSESEMLIETVFGSKLYVLGLDKPSRIEGVEWDGGIIDESSDQRPHTYGRSVAPALKIRDGFCWRIGAPKRFGPGGQEFRAAFSEGLLDGSSFTWPSWEVQPPDVIDELRREMDPKDFAEQIGGNFQDSGGQAYWSFSRSRNVAPCAWRPRDLMLVFSDFNVDPMAWCLAHFREDVKTADGRKIGGGLEVFDEIWLRDTNTQKTLDVLWQRYGSRHEGGFTFVGDPAARQRHSSASKTDYRIILNDERFKNKRVRYDSAAPAIKDRLASVNRLLLDAAGDVRLWMDERCKRLIDDMENRVLNPDGTPSEARPGHVHDSGHMSDAMGYGVYKYFPIVVESRLAQDSKLVVFGGAY